MTVRRGHLAAVALGFGFVLIALIPFARVRRLAQQRDSQEYLGERGDSVIASFYRTGRELWNKGDSASLMGALRSFQEALDLDPSFAEAYAGRAAAYVALGCSGFLSPDDALPKARAAALTALQLDSTLREPHTSLGNYYRYYERDSVHAEAEFQLGIQPTRRYPCRPSIRSGGR